MSTDRHREKKSSTSRWVIVVLIALIALAVVGVQLLHAGGIRGLIRDLII